ncbi:helix-turn-helix domain-containing protein [Micromonospora sp. RTGN7]|uniref:helix-turn-helix domain-containing protein n=1 Tax=Micromonospora sp. RTGN7 TaxID=3016526 RepID=UPI0029FED5C9|nr:helix-turn-helix domain-containing protein [Micromonospora sp. RTGN7]
MSEPISARITGEIVAARRVQGTTRDEVAAAARRAGAPASFTAAALRNLETGRRAPSVDELVWLAAALEVPVRQLLGEHRRLFGADLETPPSCGPVESATREAVRGLGELDGREYPLAEAAYALARKLDADAGMATAAVSKELRAALADIWEGRGDDEDEDEDLGPS